MTRQEKLNCIALTLEYWIASYGKEDCALDAHIINPSSWPTKGTLQEWVKVLRDEQHTH